MAVCEKLVNVGSLFSGVGGLELGLERAGMRIVWQVESDAYARAVLAKHWPNTSRYDDIHAVGAHNLEPVDLICGGFPCQDISNAGARKGITGERSGLWKEYARIIEETHPPYVLIENVSALRSRGMDTVLRDLSARGYDAEWDCIPASAVGAPHRRDRIFIVAYSQRHVIRDESRRRGWESGSGSNEPRDNGAARNVADAKVFAQRESTDKENAEPTSRQARSFISSRGWWGVEPDVGRVANGVPSRVDRLRCLGNAVVPQVAEAVGRMIMEARREYT